MPIAVVASLGLGGARSRAAVIEASRWIVFYVLTRYAALTPYTAQKMAKWQHVVEQPKLQEEDGDLSGQSTSDAGVLDAPTPFQRVVARLGVQSNSMAYQIRHWSRNGPITSTSRR
jgi:hypothetical protein